MANKQYDLSLFEEKKKSDTAATRQAKGAEKARTRQARLQKWFNRSATAVLAAGVMAMFVLMLTGQARVTELDREISQKEQMLYKLQEDQKSLENDLASKTSQQEVEEYAENELGMQAADASQIEYVTIDGGDQGEATGDSGSSWVHDVAASISEFFARIAYLFS